MNNRSKLRLTQLLLAICFVALLWTNKDDIAEKIGIEASQASGNGSTESLSGYDKDLGNGFLNNSENNPFGGDGANIDASASHTYFDERKPDYSIVNNCVNRPVQNEYTWTSFEGLYYATVCYTIDADLYNYYAHLPRYYGRDEYINYITDPMNDSYITMVVENLDEIANRRGYSDGEKVREAISFCQSFEYELDENTSDRQEWPKYPIELLFERKGDCEDSAILLAGIFKKMGYGTVLIKYDDHMAVGLKADGIDGTSFERDGNTYYYIETTNPGWYIGEIPDDYKNLEADLILIN
ncbi:MAG: hypothetical protein MJ107_06295 [Lachnospiraceae bacterium]|nr:hypothetical protein [Lachnospiraceae bacterium]